MREFKIGQKVICIETHPFNYVIKGRIYTISGFVNCKCKEKHVLIEGVENSNLLTFCPKAKQDHHFTCFYQRRFIPLQINKSAISHLVNAFVEVQEKVDIEIKELV